MTTARARPIGGPIFTPFSKFLVLLLALGAPVLAARFVLGLGATTAMSDGYPWGIWIAVDVVVGTGLASGGYALALLVFVLNRGRYHPLVRPALLTSLLGYSAAGLAVVFDLGRYWNLWKVPLMPWNWNGNSILLEVALCMMAYTAVIALELSPAYLERLAERGGPGAAARAARWGPRIERALPFVIGLGMVLPTMHQSSLGSLLLVAGLKVHPLWYTGLLPLLFLLTALSMGYAIVYVETIFAGVGFRRPVEVKLLGSLGRVVSGTLLAFLVVRLGALAASGRLGLTLTSGRLSFFFWAETLLLLAGAILFLRPAARHDAGVQLQAALLALAGSALYRVDAFLVAFDPGPSWRYFPSLGEMAVTVGLVATETLLYLVAVRRLPILAGAGQLPPRTTPAGAVAGAAGEGARP